MVALVGIMSRSITHPQNVDTRFDVIFFDPSNFHFLRVDFFNSRTFPGIATKKRSRQFLYL